MSQPNWCAPPDPALELYLQTIDKFADSMRKRVIEKPPRTWAQFWRVFSDEQLTRRQLLMKLTPAAHSFSQRDGSWTTPEMAAERTAYLNRIRKARAREEKRFLRIKRELEG